jgi:hypothetical protein
MRRHVAWWTGIKLHGVIILKLLAVRTSNLVLSKLYLGNVTIAIFWDVSPRSLVDRFHTIGRICYLHVQSRTLHVPPNVG